MSEQTIEDLGTVRIIREGGAVVGMLAQRDNGWEPYGREAALDYLQRSRDRLRPMPCPSCGSRAHWADRFGDGGVSRICLRCDWDSTTLGDFHGREPTVAWLR